MNLPGQIFKPIDNGDLVVFLQDNCESCCFIDNCTILAHAGMYGSASEWRQVGDKTICIRQQKEWPDEAAIF